MNTPEEVLMEAARILMRDGWTQGDAYDYDPESGATRACVLGAITATNEDFVLQIAAKRLLTRWLDLPPKSDGQLHELAIWNDQPERTAEDVILALKRAAAESAA